MSKKGRDTGSGRVEWTLVSQNVAIGVVVVVLGQLAYAMGLYQLPLVGVLFGGFVPLAFVTVMAYYRSEQSTKAQSIAEAVLTGLVFLAVITLVSALFSFFGSRAA